jgi:formylglycine-generating enzyme required for sulfatase activity
VERGGGRSFRNPGFEQSDDDPAVCVSYDDAKAYIAWLSKQNGRAHRLPSEPEWEYAIRAGSTTPFWWGPAITTAQANCNGSLTYAGGAKGEFRQRTVSSGFRANGWNIYGAGNVVEWTEDCWADSYQGAPADGGARSSGNCAMHAVRGGSWASDPARLRSAARAGIGNSARMNDVGFRVARTLNR